MSEREVFLNALEKDDPGARAAYLAVACAGQPELRQRVERLLRSHQQAGLFLNVPAGEQLAAAEESLAFLGPSREPDSLGRLDHYEVLEVVGRGGTGLVLRARDTKLLRAVAIKALAPRLAASGKARQRFVREAQAAAAVRDDHVVAIYAVSEEGPVPYLVMEYIHGITLEERVRQAKALELTEVLRVGVQVAKGLAAAHAQGLVHRDIKPANILLENSVQRVKITDFGLARAADDAGPTAGQVLAGTPLYMSPEQARGEATDHRTDLFSLGSVLYTLCAGRPPFRADTTAAVLKCVCEEAPAQVQEINRDVPDWLGDAINKLHAKKACDRFASAQEVADLLGGGLAHLQQPSGTLPPPAAPRTPVVPVARRRHLLGIALLVGLLVILAAVAGFLQLWNRSAADSGTGGPTSDGSGDPVEPLELRRQDIPPTLLALAGGGDPAKAPPELAAVLGDGRFLLPRAGEASWMEQSPNGQVLAVPLDEEVVLFEARTGLQVRRLAGPGGRVIHVTFSRDGRLLAATTRSEEGGGAARVWNLRDDEVLFTNQQPGRKVSGAAVFSADGRRLFAEGHERLHVWDAHSGREIQALEIHPGGIGSLGLSPEGRRLAVAAYYGRSVRVFAWDGATLKEVRSLAGHRAPVWGVVYSPDGKLLASGDGQGFKLWDAASLAERRTVETSAEQLACAPDSRTLFATTMLDPPRTVHTVARWDMGTLKELPALALPVAAEPVRAFPCWSRDGKVLFVAQHHDATYVKEFDTATGRELVPHQGHVAPLRVVAISPDGRTAASAGDDWVVKLWDLATGKVRHSLSAHTGAVHGLAFSPDRQLLASGSLDGTIALWDVVRGTEVRALHGHSRWPSRIQFSPDGQTLAAGSDGGSVKTWEVATGQEGRPLSGHAGVVRCVAFSPDGKRLASAGEDKAVLVHHLAAGGTQKFRVSSAVNDLAFSPDGRTLAAVSDAPEAAVRLWDLETGVATICKGHTGHVRGLAFSPSAPLLATCGEDDTIRLWDLTGREPAAQVIGPGSFGGGARSVAFTPDGRYLATANANGTVYVLHVGSPSEAERQPPRSSD